VYARFKLIRFKGWARLRCALAAAAPTGAGPSHDEPADPAVDAVPGAGIRATGGAGESAGRARVAGNMARETSQFMGEAHVHGWRGTWRERRQFMGEAHVHGFCNRLERSIVVVDVREPAVVLSKYQPGSDVQRQLSMLEALQLRNQPTTASSPFMGAARAQPLQRASTVTAAHRRCPYTHRHHPCHGES